MASPVGRVLFLSTPLVSSFAECLKVQSQMANTFPTSSPRPFLPLWETKTSGQEIKDAKSKLGPTSKRQELKLILRKENSKQRSHPLWPKAWHRDMLTDLFILSWVRGHREKSLGAPNADQEQYLATAQTSWASAFTSLGPIFD